MKDKRKVRKISTCISFLLFPVTFNYLSPYVSIDGALAGIISGSLIVFTGMFLSGFFFGRGWCSHVCPWSAPSDYLLTINNKIVNRKRVRIIRYSIFAVWFSIIILSFILCGGIKGINPLHLTETGISVDQPLKYITYYMVITLLFVTTIVVGRRGFCHTFCWMSPFLVLGMIVGEKIHIPRLIVVSKKELCVSCKKCNNVCPMSIDVHTDLQSGAIATQDCILCGACVDICPSGVLSIKMKNSK